MFTPRPDPERHDESPDGEQWLDPTALAALQRRKLVSMFREVRATNPFYRRKFEAAGVALDCDAIDSLPFTRRSELESDQSEYPPFGTNLTYPLSRYCRYHQTSGTHRR